MMAENAPVSIRRIDRSLNGLVPFRWMFWIGHIDRIHNSPCPRPFDEQIFRRVSWRNRYTTAPEEGGKIRGCGLCWELYTYIRNAVRSPQVEVNWTCYSMAIKMTNSCHRNALQPRSQFGGEEGRLERNRAIYIRRGYYTCMHKSTRCLNKSCTVRKISISRMWMSLWCGNDKLVEVRRWQ